jgi:hypothetical protein
MSSVVEILHRHRQRLSRADADEFVPAHDAFLRDLALVEDSALDGLDLWEEANHRAFFVQCQRRYLSILEREANARMRACADERQTTDPVLLMDEFGRASYERVRDLARLVDFDVCSEVVMVGCGAFPATLFWLQRHYPRANHVGLDVDAGCVEAAEALVGALGLGNVRFQLADGSLHDFGGADLVYVANHVAPKAKVVAQIVRSNPACQIVVREPTRRGALLSEAARESLPPG